MPKVSFIHPLRLPQQPSTNDHLVRPLQIILDMTNQQFHKFKIDWGVFKQLTTIPPSQIAAQIYSLCEDSVQNSILNTSEDFFTLREQSTIQILEIIVTKHSNPALHCLQSCSTLNFANLSQSEGESMQNFVWPKSVAEDWIVLSLVSSWFTIHPCKGSVHMRVTQQTITNRHSHQGWISQISRGYY